MSTFVGTRNAKGLVLKEQVDGKTVGQWFFTISNSGVFGPPNKKVEDGQQVVTDQDEINRLMVHARRVRRETPVA